ncbi:MAG: hypothetical protein GY816_13850 [Cytophagales bacterium]|nr:hypothetical protein [Cytophagales bacterium]
MTYQLAKPISKLQQYLTLFVLFVCQFSTYGQTQRYPANVSPVLAPPYSLFINDYTDPGKNQLVANIVFNDFNEAVWTFKLRLTIESTDIRLRTIEGFTPSIPISVQPGVLTQLSSNQWVEYFNFNNLEVSGSGISSLENAGRLPEGLYSFCLEVLDYDTGDPLSREVCSTVWIQLNDPPRINTPACGDVLNPQLMSFPFQWQLFNTQSPNALLEPEYQLTVWEITDIQADPMVAVPNGQALQVFQSEFSTQSTLIYGPAEPLLELGKRYVYRVQARSPDGRDSFKNSGYSEFCHFNYGWPEGGRIELSWPQDGGGFRSEEQPYLSWKAPDNLLPNQPVEYLIEVMELEEGQTQEDAYALNEVWYSHSLPQTFSTFGGARNIPGLSKSAQYAWKITAFTGEQRIAESDIGLFNGPSLVEYFYAGNHRVNVDYINGKDVTNISGGGKVRLTENREEWTQLVFEDISLKDNGGFWVMDAGEIVNDLPTPKIIDLSPRYEENQAAIFELERYRLDTDGLYAYGRMLWDLPFATVSTEKSSVLTSPQWCNYNNFKINTAFQLPENENSFDLLDPYNFTLDLHASSLIYINDNNFRFEFDGDVYVPDNVGRFDEGRSYFTFDDAEQLFYIEATSETFSNPIQPLANTQYWMRPISYVIDFSEQSSPGIHQGNPSWKGIDVAEFELAFDKSPDNKGQLNFASSLEFGYQQDGQNRYAHITTNGISLKLNTSFEDMEDQMRFQTFPANPLELDLEILDNNVSDQSSFTGDFLIPFIDLSKRFAFEIPINNLGFEKGFLTDLEGAEFTHNKGAGDQEIFATVKRAVLSGNERITMTIDLDWPGLNVNLTGLRDFKIWGDYSVGFSTQNGTVALEQRTNALMGSEKYPVTIGIIGAGSFNGNYLFATTADIVLGEDVSGPDDAPSANIYSAVSNPYVSEDEVGGLGELPDEGQTIGEAVSQIEQEMDELEESLLSKLNADMGDLEADAVAYQQSLASQGSIYATEDIFQTADDQASEPTNDKLYAFVGGFVQVLAMELLDPIQEKADSLNNEIKEEIDDLTDKANDQVAGVIDDLIGGITDGLVNALQNDKIDVASLIQEVATISGDALKNEIKSSLDQSVRNNLTIPIETLIDEEVMLRITQYIVENGTDAMYASLTGEGGADEFAKLITGSPQLMGEVMGEVLSFVSFENMESTILGLGEDLVSGIDMGDVAAEIRGRSANLIRSKLVDLAADAVADIASDFAEEAGLPAFDGGENSIDFVGIGSKLASGDYEGAIVDAFLVDPIPLNMRTPILDLSGMVHYTPNDPVYGDVWWSGDIVMNVKVPKPFNLQAVYVNGRKGDNSYWFAEIRGNEGGNGQDYELGETISKEARELEKPVSMGKADLVGVAGRLYHHMSETASGGIAPDPQMRFGAYMNVVFFDNTSDGENLRLAVAGEINTKENGDYTLEFNGDVQIRSQTPMVTTIDNEAAIQGTILIKYNSDEKHFLGYASIELNKPKIICAEGSLLVDVKPGQWRVALGTREDRLKFVPGCVGWSPTGWLDVNQNEAELGLGVEWSIKANTPTIPLVVAKVKFGIEAGLAAGILAAVQYNPEFALARAGIWADLYAKVLMKYKMPFKSWKQIVLIDISLSGDLTLYFIPKPTVLEGDLRGKVKVLFFNKKIKAHMKKEI